MSQPMTPEELLGTPLGFAVMALGMKPYQWQVDVMKWFYDTRVQSQGALVTPNGAGKSSGIVASLALWWVVRFPHGKVVITSKDGKQIDQQVYPALSRHRERFPDSTWVTSPYIEITFPTKGPKGNRREAKIIAFTTNDAGRAEGHHPFDPQEGWPFGKDGPVLIIVDEAKSVDDPIFEAIDRCTYAGLLYVSSPGPMEGQFYNACTKLAKAGLFKTRKVSLEECPHIPREKIDRFIAKYGPDDPLTRSSIYGEFTEEGDIPMIFSRQMVRRCLEDSPRWHPGPKTAFCDFAAGGDENVLALREGNSVRIEDAWREKDTMSACSRFVMNFRRLGLEAGGIFADNGGLGKPMIDALWRMGWEVNRVDNQSPPWDRNYVNRGGEMWHETAAAMRRGQMVLAVPEADEAIEQLCSRRSKWTEQGRLGVESKDDMKKRQLKSPDRADALCGAWACGETGMAVRQSQYETDPFMQWAMTEEAGQEYEIAGGYTGS